MGGWRGGMRTRGKIRVLRGMDVQTVVTIGPRGEEGDSFT